MGVAHISPFRPLTPIHSSPLPLQSNPIQSNPIEYRIQYSPIQRSTCTMYNVHALTHYAHHITSQARPGQSSAVSGIRCPVSEIKKMFHLVGPKVLMVMLVLVLVLALMLILAVQSFVFLLSSSSPSSWFSILLFFLVQLFSVSLSRSELGFLVTPSSTSIYLFTSFFSMDGRSK